MCTFTTEHGSSLITDNGVIPNCLYNIKPNIFWAVLYYGGYFLNE